METFFSNFSNTNLVVELLTPKNLASCRHLRVREGSWPTNQRTWRQVVKPLMRKGVAAKILEIIRYSPFFNFEYNLLTLYNFVSMHFFPKIFIQQRVSLLVFNAKKQVFQNCENSSNRGDIFLPKVSTVGHRWNLKFQVESMHYYHHCTLLSR